MVRQNCRAFTVVELVIVIGVLGILASIAITAFDGYMLRSKASEAPIGLGKLVEGEVAYFHTNQAFTAAGPTNIPPAPQGPTTVDFSIDPRWKLISFDMGQKTYFGYQAVIIATNSVNCEAMADLDGNGVSSLYRRNVSSSGNDMNAGGLYIFDELE
ncbi:MAG: Type pilus biosis protein PilE [Bacteriovoracaceae bacterium]|nr:Type pilus biosis protein PilE [Bacteriovoracaceae bacterium]